MTPTALYRHYDAEGRLLYVGVTNNPDRRKAYHQAQSDWIGATVRVDVQWHQSRSIALAAEAKAICEENPIHNKHHADKVGAKFAETGRRIKAFRVASGMSQTELARHLGFNVTQYANWETGIRRPSIEAAIVICDAFDVTLDWLFRGTLMNEAAA